MHRKLVFLSILFFGIAGLFVVPLMAEEPAKSPDKPSKHKKLSLAEVEPVIYYSFRRYSKFYGDENTSHGELLERSHLLGNPGGVRDFLVDHGFYFDAGITQFLQSNVSGGEDTGSARYNGSADYWLTFDSGKADLWSGGAVFLHAESSWRADDSVNPDVGSLLPANFDATMPTPGKSETLVLPELYLVQGLPANLLAVAGKVNWAGIADTNVFANNERTQFLYTGLVNNPILGAFAPYTSLGAAVAWAPGNHNLTAFALQSNGDATTTGFDNFNGEGTYGGQYQFSPIIGGNLPGNYRFIAGYSTKDVAQFDIDPRQLIGQLIGVTPVADKSDNYTVLVNFDQYIWIEGGSLAAYKKRLEASGYPGLGRHHLPPNGIGIFGRAGWAPKDRNVIDQFYSLGIGGYGMLIPGREYDQWGIGWSGTHISSDLRDDTDVLGIDLNSFEHAVEAFYNFQVTPASHLSVNTQVIDSVADSIDTAFTLGARMQLDF